MALPAPSGNFNSFSRLNTMKTKTSIYILLFFVSTVLKAQQEKIALISHVNVIPMDKAGVMKDQYVVLQGPVITYIGTSLPDHFKKPDLIIDGTNKFLVPGLIDCYAHIHESNLLLFVANGITTVRNAPGQPNQHIIKQKIEEGKLFGPGIYSTSIAFSSLPVGYHTQVVFNSNEEIKNAVEYSKSKGYDAIFSYADINASTYQTMVDAAKAVNIPVGGHIPVRTSREIIFSGY